MELADATAAWMAATAWVTIATSVAFETLTLILSVALIAMMAMVGSEVALALIVPFEKLRIVSVELSVTFTA